MIFMSVLMGYLLDTLLRLSPLIPSLRIVINASLLKGNEPQTTQLGADLATSPVGGLSCPPTHPRRADFSSHILVWAVSCNVMWCCIN